VIIFFISKKENKITVFFKEC